MGKNLTLTGMMGVGKSTIGKNLAKKLNYNFVDVDKLIETREGCTINQIFKTKNENYFRKVESEISLEILKTNNSVISLGGGAFLNKAIRNKVKNKLILSLAKNSGASGMVLGQALDIHAETSQKELKINEISKIQEYKTGKLISWSCEVGPIIAEENTEPFSLYAAKIGLAFQIIDDILDVTSSSKTLGKNVGKDMDKNKATFVSKLGLDNSKKKALELVSEACEAISGFKDRSRNLCQIANFIVSRQF